MAGFIPVTICRVGSGGQNSRDILINCNVCGKPATVHVTTIEGDSKTGSHFCEEHSSAAELYASFKSSFSVGGVLRILQFLLKCSHHRMQMPPKALFDEQLGVEWPIVPADWDSRTFAEQLIHLERLIEFIKKKERIPTEDEIGLDGF